MKKRVRNQIVGITVLLVLAIVAVFATVGLRGGSAVNMTVEELVANSDNVGERVKVSGAVVPGSWDKKTDPMTFEIRDEFDSTGSGPIIRVVYSGAVPSTFGDGVTAILTGEWNEDGTIYAGEMITKCPSKYESATGAYEVEQYLETSDQMVGITVRVAGTVKAGSIVPPGGAVRFIVVDKSNPSVELNVFWEGALPDGMTDGSNVVLTGALHDTGAFDATNVAMEQ